jgi:hypothetical protein
MRIIDFIILLACLANFSIAQEWQKSNTDGKAIESAILWEAELDSSWTPVAMAKVVNNKDMFEPQGNFYKVKQDLIVFGHKATYVGMLGVDLFPGPNAVLIGSPENIAAYITKYHGAKFTKHGSTFSSEYKKYIRIMIEDHPHIKGSSIIIGAYLGP